MLVVIKDALSILKYKVMIKTVEILKTCIIDHMKVNAIQPAKLFQLKNVTSSNSMELSAKLKYFSQ